MYIGIYIKNVCDLGPRIGVPNRNVRGRALHFGIRVGILCSNVCDRGPLFWRSHRVRVNEVMMRHICMFLVQRALKQSRNQSFRRFRPSVTCCIRMPCCVPSANEAISQTESERGDDEAHILRLHIRWPDYVSHDVASPCPSMMSYVGTGGHYLVQRALKQSLGRSHRVRVNVVMVKHTYCVCIFVGQSMCFTT